MYAMQLVLACTVSISMQCAYVLVHVTMATVHISHSCGTAHSIMFYQTLPLGWVWRERLGYTLATRGLHRNNDFSKQMPHYCENCCSTGNGAF